MSVRQLPAPKTKLPNQFNKTTRRGRSTSYVQAPADHNVLIPRSRRSGYIPSPSRSTRRGVSPERHERRALEWTLAARETGEAGADGKVVWS